MNKKSFTVTYAVTFTESITNGSETYEPNREYIFETKSETDHPGDLFDAAYDGIHETLGCIENGVYVKFLPLGGDPIIKSWKEDVK